jgi:cell division septation protein DedD
MSDIFLSYASSDRETAHKFADALEGLGWSVWWDREIPPGKTFDQVIEEELDSARCVVVLWSKESVRSRWVRTEASAALDRERLVPALIDTVAIPLEFKRIQAATLMDWDGDTANPEFDRLVQAVRQMLGPGQPIGRIAQQRTKTRSGAANWWQTKAGLLGGAAVVMIIVVGLIAAKNVFQKASQQAPQVPDNTSPVPIPPSPSNPNQSASSSSPEPSPNEKAARSKGAFSIKIGDKIDDGVPGPGAGAIETPYGQDAYVLRPPRDKESIFACCATVPACLTSVGAWWTGREPRYSARVWVAANPECKA